MNGSAHARVPTEDWQKVLKEIIAKMQKDG